MATDSAGSDAVRLGHEPIDTARLLAAVADPAAGGYVLFLGTARAITAGVVTNRLAYEAHEPLALAALQRLRQQAIDRFGLVACAVWHRLGTVTPGEASVAVAASAAHRREAFAAAEWLMERIKHEVPIWKCEEGEDGRREWLHPTAAMPGEEAVP
jgi:molybdopterin synthase catalytic subunit